MSRRHRELPTPRTTSAAEDLRAIVRANLPMALGATLRRLACASVAAAAVASAGCTGSHFPPEGELTPPSCVDGAWRPLSNIDTPATYDYLGVITREGMVPTPRMVDELGVRCEGASDAAACDAAAATALEENYGRFFLSSAGDTVRVYGSADAVLEVLGPIDTNDEALLRAWTAGYDVRCSGEGRAGAMAVEGGYEVVGTQVSGGCGSPLLTTRYLLFVSREGEITILEEEVIERIEEAGCAGRRPEGLRPASLSSASSEAGRYFASMARLEEAAVTAFDVMARELEALDAPSALVMAASAAADDEVRHAEVMAALARRHGAEPMRAETESRPLRPLFELALENAVEGCVRETFGAVLAHHQALAAEPDVARAMASVAEEETRHAELSWAIAAWAEPRLEPSEREALAVARAEAIEALRLEARAEPASELQRVAGLPSARAALGLLDELEHRIWA